MTPPSTMVVGSRVDLTSYDDAVEKICGWAERGESRYVVVSTVNNVVESMDDPEYRQIVNDADLVTPDGMPLVWALRMLGMPEATRVYGPDLMPAICAQAAHQGIPIALYGGTTDVLVRLGSILYDRFPGLKIAFAWSPPFRKLTPEEDGSITRSIAASGARIVFVGIGSPKQDRWAASRKGELPAVMVGVGAAFDFLSGSKKQAPVWMQDHGLEWAFRLFSEPRRLWRRYLVGNPRFVYHFAGQLLRQPGRPLRAG